MVLNRVHTLYTPKWQAGLRESQEAAMAAEIVLYAVSERVYDPETDTWMTPTTTWYTGPARVQPIRTAREADLPGNSTSIQGVRISIPVANNTVDFRPALQVRVLEAPLNPSLTEYAYVVSDVLDSDKPFERTLECTVDQEAVAD